MERFSFVFLIAGLGFFVLSFAVSGYIPMLEVDHMDVRTVEQMASQPPLTFLELKEGYPDAFAKAYGAHTPMDEAFATALRVGHQAYIAEACWHCHSQQVRPWGNDEAYYGRVSYPEEYHNELNMPPLWGTRRIGPDLIRRGAKQSNDWHIAHFWKPVDVNPTSVMPQYPWFYETDDPATPVDESLMPNKTGLSVIAYVQWLGSWNDDIEETIHGLDAINTNNPPPHMVWPPAPPAAAPSPGPQAPAADTPGDTGDDDGYNDGGDADEDGYDDY